MDRKVKHNLTRKV